MTALRSVLEEDAEGAVAVNIFWLEDG